MTRKTHNLDDQLLALELGWLSDAESKALRARLENDPRLAQEHEAMSRLVTGLSSMGAEILEEPLPPAMQDLMTELRASNAAAMHDDETSEDKP